MKRKQLFLLHEQSWLPAAIRESIAEYLRFTASSNTIGEDGLEELASEIRSEEEQRVFGNSFYNKDSILAMEYEAASDETVMLTLHRLNKFQALRVLTKAAWQRQQVNVMEERTDGISTFVETASAPIKSILFAVSPSGFSIRNFLFNILLPIVPIAATWDTYAGIKRKYTVNDLEELVAHIDVPDYSFSIGTHAADGNRKVTYLIGKKLYRKAA